ncbi:MAG: ribose 5-phosphate isomerase A [Bacteroidales bacterium]|nr:ribose 5-phosphate isomerase A [Bacteroidales bacterium]
MIKPEVLESDEIKRIIGGKAADYVKDGMVVGLGSGTTVRFTIHSLGQKVAEGLQIIGVPTSHQTEVLAHHYKIPVVPIEDVKQIDLTIDGADLVDANGNGIKGKHGAFLKEKMVARLSKKNIWVITENKLAGYLGKVPLPIEILKDSFLVLNDLSN